MSVFKVQKIRSCTQCGVVLGFKCKGCVAHPDRKPKEVVLYDWPPILETCPSGHCIRIACQRPGCVKFMWRLLKTAKGGKSIYEESFCSRTCNILVRAAEKNKKVMVRCSWDGCTTLVPRKPSETKKLKRAFCRPDHYFLKMRKDIHDAKESSRKADEALSMLQCSGRCRGAVTEHTQIAVHTAQCLTCSTERDSRIKVTA